MSGANGPRAAVALDGHGADGGPELVAAGAALAAADGIPVRLFGPAGLEVADGVELVACEEWIANDDDPLGAVRSRPGASIVRACADVAEGNSGAVVSAGSTGATMTAALFGLKRIRGVHRPALAAQVPVPAGAAPGINEGHRTLLLDCGANNEVRAQHLVQFAFLGSAFAQAVLGVECPRVALLSVGEEEKKGTPDVVAAHAELSGAEGIEFTGNVEGRDLLTGAADVIVSDGFTGNVALKTLEGTARGVSAAVGAAARSNPLSALGGLLLRPALGGLRAGMDPNGVGGAILLGLRGAAIVAHGSSTPEGIANAVRLGSGAADEQVVARTRELLEASGATRASMRDSAAADVTLPQG